METQQSKTNIGTWKAWTNPLDFITHLYVSGTIPNDGEEPIYFLEEAVPQGVNGAELILVLKPDVINESGTQTANVQQFSKMDVDHQYSNVLITTESRGVIASVQVSAIERALRTIGEWEAWTKDADLVPHLYVRGTFPTNGELPMFRLTPAEPQGPNPSQLILDLQPDLVDETGGSSANVYFQEILGNHEYDSVLIRSTRHGVLANVPVVQKP